jgi:XTP/dITP diphosphohydrolase
LKVVGAVTLASSNPGKLAELRELCGSRLDLRLLAPGYVAPSVAEDAGTYAGNALLKARAYSELTGGFALADDSGLEVDALGGAPGVHSARYGGVGLRDAERCKRLLDELAACEAGAADRSIDRRARFRCVLALVGGADAVVAEGVLEGRIALGPRGSGGFGYDPIFVVTLPGVGERTLAELAASEKNRISHRAAAMRQLLAKINGTE